MTGCCLTVNVSCFHDRPYINPTVTVILIYKLMIQSCTWLHLNGWMVFCQLHSLTSFKSYFIHKKQLVNQETMCVIRRIMKTSGCLYVLKQTANKCFKLDSFTLCLREPRAVTHSLCSPQPLLYELSAQDKLRCFSHQRLLLYVLFWTPTTWSEQIKLCRSQKVCIWPTFTEK